jgi:hypothetical protein
MTADNELSRRAFLGAVTALTSGFLAGCGGNGQPGVPVTLAEPDARNLQAFLNDLKASQASGSVSSTLLQLFQSVQANFTADEITTMANFAQTLDNEAEGKAYLAQYYNASENQFVFPADVQAAVAKAQAVFPPLPYSGGLTVITNVTENFLSAREVGRIPAAVVACVIFGYGFSLIAGNIPTACATTGYNNCITTANYSLSTALGIACATLTAGVSTCVAGSWLGPIALPICLATVGILLAVLISVATIAYVEATKACAGLCRTGSSGGTV